jgi:hypothetical protein
VLRIQISSNDCLFVGSFRRMPIWDSKAVQQVPRNKSQWQRSTGLETLSPAAQSNPPAATLTQHALPPESSTSTRPPVSKRFHPRPLCSIHPSNQIPRSRATAPLHREKTKYIHINSKPQFPSNIILPFSLLQAMTSSSTADCNHPLRLI